MGMGDNELHESRPRLTWLLRKVAQTGRILRAMHGLDPDGPVTPEALLVSVHPESRGALPTSYAHLPRRGGSFDQAYRVVLPNGASRWIQARVNGIRPIRPLRACPGFAPTRLRGIGIALRNLATSPRR